MFEHREECHLRRCFTRYIIFMKKTLAAVAIVATSASALLYAAHAQEAGSGVQLEERKPLAVESSIEKLADGVRITQTTKDADTLTRLHAMADKHNLMSQITTTVENVENGVKIRRTSTNADAVKLLQEEKQPQMKERPVTAEDLNRPSRPEITHTQSNIDNGVEILITSTDADTVKRLQEMEAKTAGQKGGFPMMPFGGEGRHPGKGFGARGGFKAPAAQE